MELEFPPGPDRYKYFGQFFLGGLVCPPLKKSVIAFYSLVKRLLFLHLINAFINWLLFVLIYDNFFLQLCQRFAVDSIDNGQDLGSITAQDWEITARIDC